MELVIVTLGIGTFILLATHMVDYAAESRLRYSNVRTMPEDEGHEIPLPFEETARYDRAA